MNDIGGLDERMFIGRSQEVKDALETLMSTEEGVIWDVFGVHGIGKSELLRRVCWEAEGLGDKVCLFSKDMADAGLEKVFREGSGPNAGGPALLAASRRLMLAMVEEFESRTKPKTQVFDMFKNVCEKQRRRVEAFERQRHEGSDSATARGWSGADLRQIRELQEEVDASFVEAWEDFTRRRHVLVTLDTLDGMAGDELSRWIVSMALRLPKTLTLVARAPSRVELAPERDRLVQVPLTYFTVDQVNESLCRRVKVDGFRPGVAEVVHRFTDGHPGGVALVAELIKEKGCDIEARAMRRVLDRLPDNPAEKWAGLVKIIVAGVSDPLLRKAVDAASIVLSFDAKLLAHLLAEQGDGEYNAGDAWRALEGYRLIQDAPSLADQPRRRLPEFIRVSLDDKLRVEEHVRWEGLHRGAAEYYYQLLQEDEATETGGTYASWYRYESPTWQAYKRQWLYHSGRLPDRRERTRAEFVAVFLSAFWWFGCYYPFDFNRGLLDDWERATTAWGAGPEEQSPLEDQQLVDALGFLLDNYPMGYLKTPDAPWDQMRSSLLLVQDLCGLSPDKRLPKEPEERRSMARARAMISVFLAHTWRFSHPEDPEVDRYYGQAQQTFEKLKDDEWMVAWLLFETADLALERGRTDEALSLVARSAERNLAQAMADEASNDGQADDDGLDLEEAKDSEGDWDYELLADLYRVRADAHWMSGELAEAALDYGRAVSSSYWFQRIPNPPDEYTQRFYAEMTHRSSERIIALAERDEDAAVHFAAELCTAIPSPPEKSAVAEVVRSRAVQQVANNLFPRGPDTTELRDAGSPFLHLWRDRYREHVRDRDSTPVALLSGLTDHQGRG